MEKTLWRRKSVILTSTALTTGDFEYLRRWLERRGRDELTVGSPFDYENSALVYLAQDVPNPKPTLSRKLPKKPLSARLAKAALRQMLALFVYSTAKDSRAIEGPLAKGRYYRVRAGRARPRQRCWMCSKTPRAGLLGTRSFWGGRGCAGEALSVLVITKLPFDV